jgi:hypothetical protein
MRDYLAARYIVESGKFTPSTIRDWNARAAYAACLVPDATESIVSALKVNPNDLFAFSECVYNNAPFDSVKVAEGVIQHFSNRVSTYNCTYMEDRILVEAKDPKVDFFEIVNDDFLDSLMWAGIAQHKRLETAASMFVLSFTLAEMRKRGKKITPAIANQLRISVKNPNLKFDVKRVKGRTVFDISELIAK